MLFKTITDDAIVSHCFSVITPVKTASDRRPSHRDSSPDNVRTVVRFGNARGYSIGQLGSLWRESDFVETRYIPGDEVHFQVYACARLESGECRHRQRVRNEVHMKARAIRTVHRQACAIDGD